MNTTSRLMLIALLAASTVACNKEEEAPQQVEQAPVAAPTGDDLAEWRPYVSDAVTRNMGGITNQPYVYLLPAEGSADFQGSYERLLDKAKTDVARGIVRGNMLAYASPSSGKMADIVVASFTEVAPKTMEGVKVLFIGDAADDARVRAVVEPAGVEYQFVEAK